MLGWQKTQGITRSRQGVAAAFAALLALGACDEAAPPQQASAPPSVGVARAELRSINPSTEYIGRVEAIDKYDVRARVTGFLHTRHFTEGDRVRTGDLLFTIEQPPFAAEVALRQAAVERAEADLHYATLQVQRGRELVRTNAIPQSTVDDRIATEAQAKADLASAHAQLDQARIQFAYTEIRAVFDGRTGRSPLTPGNVVGPNSGVLVTVVRDDPVRVIFPVTQRELLQVRRANTGNADAAAGIEVLIRLADGSMLGTAGRLEFVDVTANRSTDSVAVQAIVPNGQLLLTDGQAVTVVLRERRPQQSIVVPQAAVQIDQQGAFVLVVGADNKVERQRVRLSDGPAGHNIVNEGLQAGQIIIVEGSQRARPGQPVTPRPVETPRVAAPPGGTTPPPAAPAGNAPATPARGG